MLVPLIEPQCSNMPVSETPEVVTYLAIFESVANGSDLFTLGHFGICFAVTYFLDIFGS